MILYHTTFNADQQGVVTRECTDIVCRMRGKDYPHQCFTTKPMRGRGDQVFVIDLPEAQVAQYEYQNEFYAQANRYFAIPLSMLTKARIEEETVESVTGTPWNQFTVTVLDRERKGTLLEEWAVIYSSRDGLARARVADQARDGEPDLLVLDIMTTVDFQPDTDYIVVESHKVEELLSRDTGTKETYEYKTIAGTAPMWMIYPTAWKEWVWNKNISESAIRWLSEQFPELARKIDFAKTRTSKLNRTRGWEAVALGIEDHFKRKLSDPITLGVLRSHSWTAVEAMPMRLARRVSEHLPYAKWHPPVEQPQFANPETSGRVVLANPFGAYPTQGPGIDHRTADRAHMGLEGEVEPERSPFGDPLRRRALA